MKIQYKDSSSELSLLERHPVIPSSRQVAGIIITPSRSFLETGPPNPMTTFGIHGHSA